MNVKVCHITYHYAVCNILEAWSPFAVQYMIYNKCRLKTFVFDSLESCEIAENRPVQAKKKHQESAGIELSHIDVDYHN